MTPRIVSLLLLALLLAPYGSWAEKPKAGAVAKKSAKKSVTLNQLVAHVLKNGARETLPLAVGEEVGLKTDTPVRKMVFIKKESDERSCEYYLYVAYKTDGKSDLAQGLIWESMSFSGSKASEKLDWRLFKADTKGDLLAAASGGGIGENIEIKAKPLDAALKKDAEDIQSMLLGAGLKNLK